MPKPFNTKLLNFLFELSQKKHCMNYRTIAKEIRLENGKRLSEKTVQSWLNFLRSPSVFNGQKLYRKFTYHPNFCKELLDLEYFYVFVEDAKHDLLDAFSNIYHVVWVYDPKYGKKALVVSFLIPGNRVPSFRRKWVWLKKKGSVTNYKLFNVNTPYIVYSPWHKTVDSGGLFHPEGNAPFIIEKQINDFSRYWSDLPNPAMHRTIKNNPLIVPVLFEYDKENISSPEAWNRMKARMGNDIWNYIKKKGRKNDGIGIKRIQQTLKEIHANNMFHQVRVDYDPLELSNFWVYIYVNFPRKETALNKLRDICRKSIVTYIYPERNTCNLFIAALINQNVMHDFFDSISDEKAYIRRTFFVLHSKSYDVMHNHIHRHINYWSLFDPERCRWVDKKN
ncbi:MAG: hypothetical protein HYW25_04415 [Candidatus Aenigmarchaeota archaeon]|nr:hypothetical protein [Candidatus Aenigmarchaeota archaeon]